VYFWHPCNLDQLQSAAWPILMHDVVEDKEHAHCRVDLKARLYTFTAAPLMDALRV